MKIIILLMILLHTNLFAKNKVEIKFDDEPVYGDVGRLNDFCFSPTRLDRGIVKRYLKVVSKYEDFQRQVYLALKSHNQYMKMYNKYLALVSPYKTEAERSLVNDSIKKYNEANENIASITRLIQESDYINLKNTNTHKLFLMSFAMGKPSMYAFESITKKLESFFEKKQDVIRLKYMEGFLKATKNMALTVKQIKQDRKQALNATGVSE